MPLQLNYELLQLPNGSVEAHGILRMPGDGSCLFSSLSQLVYGDISHSTQMRFLLTEHISTNWERLGVFTCDRKGSQYNDAICYAADMSNS
ncbi:hypothetical protein JTE90_001849 [Oedothorax gibbosus]|uniref:OTU domain-containing protein n=1 Tax=Oedothorax gibbosus TaxID=931172 RepID=A0AAV6VQ42_9ARAC|nr:hypothetical protein JTE90_001849 [Oedothorax gibbosus]